MESQKDNPRDLLPEYFSIEKLSCLLFPFVNGNPKLSMTASSISNEAIFDVELRGNNQVLFIAKLREKEIESVANLLDDYQKLRCISVHMGNEEDYLALEYFNRPKDRTSICNEWTNLDFRPPLIGNYSKVKEHLVNNKVENAGSIAYDIVEHDQLAVLSDYFENFTSHFSILAGKKVSVGERVSFSSNQSERPEIATTLADLAYTSSLYFMDMAGFIRLEQKNYPDLIDIMFLSSNRNEDNLHMINQVNKLPSEFSYAFTPKVFGFVNELRGPCVQLCIHTKYSKETDNLISRIIRENCKCSLEANILRYNAFFTP